VSVDIDETALAGPEHLDPACVAGYDCKSAFDPAEDVAILRACGLGPDSTLIDFGAGTGTFERRRGAGRLPRPCARRRPRRRGLHPRRPVRRPGPRLDPAELETHVREEHSTFTWLLEPMLADAGLELVASAYAPIGAYADYTCVRS
jgi:hypothetical protein